MSARTISFLIGDEAMQLFINAEHIVHEECCEKRVHHREGMYPGECSHFRAPKLGILIDCDGYVPKEDHERALR